jgi:hypothetical protein
MLKNFLGKLFGDSFASGLRAADPERWEASLLDRVRETSPNDPLIGAKVGGKELASRLIEAMKKDSGVHVESLMCAAGALGGYSCQAAVRANNRSKGQNELAGLSVATPDDGQKFLFGDPLNLLLAEGESSLWAFAAGGAKDCGCRNLPDLRSIFEHVAHSVGTSSFGMPRLLAEHPVHELPYYYLERLWPQFFPFVERFCTTPEHWPALYGIAIQNLLSQSKKRLDPCVALQIIMESAIPMSKVQLRTNPFVDPR